MSNEPQTHYDIERLKNALRSPRWAQYFMDNRDVQEMFGKKRGNHLPDEGFEIVHNGVTIKCTPKTPFNGRKSSKHRVHYFCACCKFIPLGRAHQHLPHCEANDATI